MFLVLFCPKPLGFSYWRKEIISLKKMSLVTVQPPVLQLLLEERPADTGGVVQLPSAVVIQHLGEDPRVPAVQYSITISDILPPLPLTGRKSTH